MALGLCDLSWRCGSDPLASIGEVFELDQLESSIFLFLNLINYSRPYPTGFSRSESLSPFSRSELEGSKYLQWKWRGLFISPSSLRWKTSTCSFGKRSLHEQGFIPRVMSRLQNHRFTVDEDRCFGCGACIALCPVDVLTLTNRMVYVDEEHCTHCRLCIPSCPVSALELKPHEVE